MSATTPGWEVAAAAAAPEQTPPMLRPVVSRMCAICSASGPDMGITSAEREDIRMGRSAVVVPADSVSKALIHWREPLPGKEWTDDYRCEDHEACHERVMAFGDDCPLHGCTRRHPDRPRAVSTWIAPPEPPEPEVPASSQSLPDQETADVGGLDWDAA